MQRHTGRYTVVFLHDRLVNLPIVILRHGRLGAESAGAGNAQGLVVQVVGQLAESCGLQGGTQGRGLGLKRTGRKTFFHTGADIVFQVLGLDLGDMPDLDILIPQIIGKAIDNGATVGHRLVAAPGLIGRLT